MIHKSVEAILNGLSVAVFVVDSDHTILFRNSASTALFGTGVRGKLLGSFVPHARCLSAVDGVLDGAVARSVEVKIQLAVPTLFKVTIIRMDPDVEPEAAQAVVSFEDISHIREAQQMRSDFVANVSHELRSPLTALSGFIETLQGPARGDLEAGDRFLGLMEQEAERMARLIDDLLSLSKLQAQERLAPTEPVDLGGVLERVIAALEPIIKREGAELRLKVAPGLPQTFGEEDNLTQVFRNLIENAVKYSRPGTTVEVRAAPSSSDPGMIKIAIRDQGDGIAPEHIARLTERFYRIDKGRSRDKGGTGLGLAIVKHILVRHRGRLQIESEIGQGSEFIVYLPSVN